MASPRTIKELEFIAIQFRNALGMTDVEYIDLTIVLEKMKDLFGGFNYQRVPAAKLHSSRGMYDPDTGLMEIPENVFAGMESGVSHHRFSVAHEISHVVLKHQGVRFRHAKRKAYEKVDGAVWRDEREAEKFAAILLAPTHLAIKCKNVEELQSTFGLSRPAAEIRNQEIEASIRTRNGELRPLPPKVVDFLRYAESKGYRVSNSKVELPPLQPSGITQSNAVSGQQGRLTGLQSVPSGSEICGGCGNLTLDRVGLRLVCRTCGMRLPL
jgi:hypothetical protein